MEAPPLGGTNARSLLSKSRNKNRNIVEALSSPSPIQMHEALLRHMRFITFYLSAKHRHCQHLYHDRKGNAHTCFPNPPWFRLLLCRPIQLSTYAHYYVHREAQTSLHESSSDPHNIGAHIRKQKSKFRWRLARRTYLLADNKRAPRVHWRGNAGVRMGSASCHHTILTWVNDDGASLLAEQRSHRDGKQASRWVDPGTCHDVSAALVAPRASSNPPTGMGSTEDSLLAAPTSVDFV